MSNFYLFQNMPPLVPQHFGRFYGVFHLAKSMYFQKPKKGQTKLAPDDDEDKASLDESARIAASRIIEFALSGQPLPDSFLALLVQRNRAEKRVTRPRAALTRMVLLSRKEIPLMPDEKTTLFEIAEDFPNPAYHLGRLLAVLDDIQHAVMKANTTLVDRFYGSMSTTPYAVMGRLIQGSQAHLQKLRKENKFRHDEKQELLGNVMARLQPSAVPQRPLTTKEQALFSLGYYHQKAALAAEMRERVSAANERKAKADAQDNTAADADTTANEGDPSHE